MSTQQATQIIFLDIDGVMLPERAYALPENVAEVKSAGSMSFARPERVALHPEAVDALSQLGARHPEAKLVLCSSWRHNLGVAPTIACLTRHGVDQDFWHEDPACPWVPPTAYAAELGATTSSSKAADILAWLNKHLGAISTWVVLDDDGDLVDTLQAAPVPGSVLQIDTARGLTEQDLDRISAALKPAEVERSMPNA